MRPADGEDGQGTVEWIGLVLLVAVLAGALGALALGPLPTAGLVRALATRLLCATDLSGSCSPSGALVSAYGAELAARVSQRAPELAYEEGMSDLPVDFRSCRATWCERAADAGPIRGSETGEPAAAFVHVVDCRTAEAREAGARHGYECSGQRAGNLYIQYWLYYADSATTPWSELPGGPSSHQDDWEGYQVRIGGGAVEARATSHHGYAYRGGPLNWPSDAGVVSGPAWGDATGRLYVSEGSHAGHVYEPPRLALVRGVRTAGRAGAALAAAMAGRRRPPSSGGVRVSFTARRRPVRWTPADGLRLIPIERLTGRARRTRFSITPPWRKPVYRDPEDEGT
jgi:hypothetical protein